MDMNDILKSIGQKQSQEKKKSAPRIQMIHYTKLKPSPDNFYDTEGIEKLAAAIRIAGEIKNPLRVRKTDIDEYEVNEGHRRRLATIYNVEQLGIKEFEFVPCVVEDTTSTIGKLNLILSNSTQRERTEYEKMQETAKLRILLEQYAKENETKIPSTDMRKMISTILGVSGTKVAQLESINRNLVDEAKEQFKDGSMPVSVANEMAGLPEEIQRDLSKQEDIKLSQVKEIKEDSKENAKIMCKYDNSKNCHTKLIQRQQEHLDTNGPCSGCCRLCDHPSNCRYRCENTPLGWKPTQQHCEYVCENVLENKKISEKDLESVTFTFQDVKTTLRYINQQISKTKMNDKETIVRLKVISESLKKYLKEMKVVTENDIERFEQLYPDLDIHAEMRKIYAWLINNTKKRKTKRGMPKFLNGWINRSYVQFVQEPKARANAPKPQIQHNFTQRDYDFDDLEQQLLRKQQEGM